jgi:hypothetical protein
MCGAFVGAAMLPAGTAAAQDAQSDRLQRQIDALQQQLIELKKQVKETKKSVQNAQPAAGAGYAAPTGGGYQNAGYTVNAAPFSNAGVPTGPAAMPKKGAFPESGIKVTLGGFIEAATVYRQRNLVSDGASDPAFNLPNFPFPNSPLYHENEWEASARQSRINFQVDADIDPVQHLRAYYQMDFLGAGVTSNPRESNSYTPRIRLAFMEYENADWHFHFLAGQNWSLLTQNREGIISRTENSPLTIDAQYVVGFDWARQEQVRLVWDWNRIAWFGVSVEEPAVNQNSNGVFPFSGSAATANIGGGTLPPGLTVNDINAGNASGLLNNTTGYATNESPDFVQKFALDPGWGHYEVVGLERFFTDRVYTTFEGSGANKTNFGWGVGGSVLLPVLPKFLDLQGSVLTGKGIGRYGSSQLPDVTIGSNGSLVPLQETQVLLGAVAHPWTGLDVYAYAGQEQVSANYWNIGSTHGGYGNPLATNNACLLENQTGGAVLNGNDTTATIPGGGTGCTGNTKRSQEITVGFWQDAYKGPMGRLVLGLQYEYVRLTAFDGVPTGPGAPNAGLTPDDNIIYTSIRFYPFQ